MTRKGGFFINWFLVVVNCQVITSTNAQTIQCSFPSLQGTKVKFGTFEGLNSKTLDSANVDSKGNFSFHFSFEKPAIGYLVNAENKPYFLILDKGEQISLKGEYLSMPETIKVLSGKQNQA
jgi:hypothetical protein